MSTVVKNPLISDGDLVEESLDSNKLSIISPEEPHGPPDDIHHNYNLSDKTMSPHNDHHDPNPPPTRLPEWMQDGLEKVFKLKKRKTTFEFECYCGLIQFISCLYVLPVVPFQMARVAYDETSSIIATAVTCAVGSIVSSFLTDMPFIIAPPTSVSIFLAVSMQQQNLHRLQGNNAVILSGGLLTLVGAIPPVAKFVGKLIPDCIQASTGIGIGLITALAGAIEVGLVVKGKYTVVDMGEITLEIIVAILALIVVAVCLHYHVKGAFCSGLIFGTFLWWIISNEWPDALVANPVAEHGSGSVNDKSTVLLTFNLLFLYILTLNGLARSLSDLAGLTKKSGAVPRGNILFIVCGLTTILSGYLSGPPILISPETAAGIKAGAKTGISTLVCGILFGISVFFYPVFAAVPAPGTAPLLIMVGVVLFNNTKRIDWMNTKEAVPAYMVLFFIPFTYSILRGVAFGYIVYIFIGFFTGDFITKAELAWEAFREPKKIVGHLKDLMPISAEDRGDLDADDTSKNIFEKWMDKMDMEDHDISAAHF